jgi:hypothetical protein
MVGPVTPSERTAFARKVQAVVTLLVGASAGLVALRADASLAAAGVAVAVGSLVGVVIAWYVVPTGYSVDRHVRREGARADGSGNRDDGSGNTDHDRSTGSDRQSRRF